MEATFWVQFGVTGLSYILGYRICSPPFYTPLATTYPPSVSPENHVIPTPPPPKKKRKEKRKSVFYNMTTSSF